MELMAVPGIEFVPLPAEYSGGVVFAAAVGATAGEIIYSIWLGHIALPLIKAKGMEPG
jgi:hypothetical protein